MGRKDIEGGSHNHMQVPFIIVVIFGGPAKINVMNAKWKSWRGGQILTELHTPAGWKDDVDADEILLERTRLRTKPDFP